MTEQERQDLMYLVFDVASTLQNNQVQDITQEHILDMLQNLEVANDILESNLEE